MAILTYIPLTVYKNFFLSILNQYMLFFVMLMKGILANVKGYLIGFTLHILNNESY